MAGLGIVLAEMPLVSMTATLRHEPFQPEDTHFDEEGVKWIRLSSAIAAKRRFGPWTLAQWVVALNQERDRQGVQRFRLCSDLHGSQWVASQSKAQRRSGR